MYRQQDLSRILLIYYFTICTLQAILIREFLVIKIIGCRFSWSWFNWKK